jgi:hypothetical protein
MQSQSKTALLTFEDGSQAAIFKGISDMAWRIPPLKRGYTEKSEKITVSHQPMESQAQRIFLLLFSITGSFSELHARGSTATGKRFSTVFNPQTDGQMKADLQNENQ